MPETRVIAQKFRNHGRGGGAKGELLPLERTLGCVSLARGQLANVGTFHSAICYSCKSWRLERKVELQRRVLDCPAGFWKKPAPALFARRVFFFAPDKMEVRRRISALVSSSHLEVCRMTTSVHPDHPLLT